MLMSVLFSISQLCFIWYRVILDRAGESTDLSTSSNGVSCMA